MNSIKANQLESGDKLSKAELISKLRSSNIEVNNLSSRRELVDLYDEKIMKRKSSNPGKSVIKESSFLLRQLMRETLEKTNASSQFQITNTNFIIEASEIILESNYTVKKEKLFRYAPEKKEDAKKKIEFNDVAMMIEPEVEVLPENNLEGSIMKPKYFDYVNQTNSTRMGSSDRNNLNDDSLLGSGTCNSFFRTNYSVRSEKNLSSKCTEADSSFLSRKFQHTRIFMNFNSNKDHKPANFDTLTHEYYKNLQNISNKSVNKLEIEEEPSCPNLDLNEENISTILNNNNPNEKILKGIKFMSNDYSSKRNSKNFLKCKRAQFLIEEPTFIIPHPNQAQNNDSTKYHSGTKSENMGIFPVSSVLLIIVLACIDRSYGLHMADPNLMAVLGAALALTLIFSASISLLQEV